MVDSSPTFQRWGCEFRAQVPKGRLIPCALHQPPLRDSDLARSREAPLGANLSGLGHSCALPVLRPPRSEQIGPTAPSSGPGFRRGVKLPERLPARPGALRCYSEPPKTSFAPPTASIILHRMRPRSATSGEYLRSTSVWHTEVLRRYPIDGLVILAPEVGPEARLVMISLRAVTLPRLWGQAKGGMEG